MPWNAIAWLIFEILSATAPAGRAFATPPAWTNYQANNSNNAVFPGTLDVKWSFDTGGKINGGLAIANDTLYVSSFSKRVFALDLTTGKERWSARMPDIVMSTPIVADGLVIVGTGTNHVMEDRGPITIWGRRQGDDVIALRQSDGARVWDFHTVGEDMPTPALTDGRLVFANGDMHAYALDVHTGKLLWKVPTPGVTTMSATATGSGYAFLIASHGLNYAMSSHATHVMALSPRTGRIAWSSEHGNSDCSPTVSRGLVICEGSNYAWYGVNQLGWMGSNDVDAYSQHSGKLIWRWVGSVGYYTSVGSSERGVGGVAANGILYQSIPTIDEVKALYVASGKGIFTFHTAAPVKMSGVVVDGKVIFGDTAGMLYAIDGRTAQIQSLTSFKHPFATSPPIVVGKTLFIANGSTVHAIPLSTLDL
jgi:outer membrane protein assembly factor BamB